MVFPLFCKSVLLYEKMEENAIFFYKNQKENSFAAYFLKKSSNNKRLPPDGDSPLIQFL